MDMADPHTSQVLNFEPQKGANSPRAARRNQDPKPLHFKEMDPEFQMEEQSRHKGTSAVVCAIL